MGVRGDSLATLAGGDPEPLVPLVQGEAQSFDELLGIVAEVLEEKEAPGFPDPEPEPYEEEYVALDEDQVGADLSVRDVGDREEK